MKTSTLLLLIRLSAHANTCPADLILRTQAKLQGESINIKNDHYILKQKICDLGGQQDIHYKRHTGKEITGLIQLYGVKLLSLTECANLASLALKLLESKKNIIDIDRFGLSQHICKPP